jgi:hypothetical protein
MALVSNTDALATRPKQLMCENTPSLLFKWFDWSWSEMPQEEIVDGGDRGGWRKIPANPGYKGLTAAIRAQVCR